MAKVLLGVAFAQIRGSIGGTVFSQNSNGAYIRNRSEPVNPNTISQQAARAVLTGNASAWKTLTDAERLTWINQTANYPYVDSLGQTKYYTPQQLFMVVNQRLVQAGEARLLSIIAPLTLPTFDSMTAVYAAGAGTFNITLTIDGSTTTPANVLVQLYASAPLTAGKRFVSKSMLRKIATVANSTVTPTDAAANYEAVFGTGTIVAGSRIALRAVIIHESTGQASSPVDLFVIAGA